MTAPGESPGARRARLALRLLEVVAGVGLCQILHRYAPGGLADSDRVVLAEMAAPVVGRAGDALGLLRLLRGEPPDA